MSVCGFRLPPAFVQLRRAIAEGKRTALWVGKGDVDAYGNPWGRFDITVSTDLERMEEDTAYMSLSFHQDRRLQQHARTYGNEPGFISDFSDVSKLVWFARTDYGEPICFDFGGNPEEPSVIHWHDAYWRRVAPNFESFIALFHPVDEAEPYEPSEEEWDEALPPRRSLFEGIAARYAQKSAEERRELEKEIWKHLESEGIDDEERRKAEELLERLRSSVEG